MKISAQKIFFVGEKIKCILEANSYLQRGTEYTVDSVKQTSEGNCFVSIVEESGLFFNSARFISVRELRQSQIDKLLDDE